MVCTCSKMHLIHIKIYRQSIDVNETASSFHLKVADFPYHT